MNKILKYNFQNIEKPARYVGGEYNSKVTEFDAKKVSNCFCFPDVYEVGMSHTGMKILYEILNAQPNCFCERCFAPMQDFAKVLKENNAKLFSLETQTDLDKFDAVHFTFQYEFSYTTFLWMLELSRIPKYASERNQNCPIIIGGGPCSVNLEPIAEFLDLVIIGDGEEVNVKLQNLLFDYKQHKDKKRFLQEASTLQGVYVPSLYEMENQGKFVVARQGQNKVQKAVVDDLNATQYMDCPVVPNIEIVHDRTAVELFRGCTRGCRFCQAGFYYRPVRERTPEKIREIAQNLIDNTGYDELSLFSLSTGDYPNLPNLIKDLKNDFAGRKIQFAFPSLRLDSFDGALALSSRKSSLTFAPEAGTQRLRDVINKNITEEQILTSLKQAFEQGYDKIKLYFIIGLPTETNADLDGIVDIAVKIKNLHKEVSKSKRFATITVSTSIFIPKPFTPFCFERHISRDEAQEKIDYLKEKLKKEHIVYDYHGIDASRVETLLARGDRTLSKAILLAQENGCIFDSWGENFDINKWNNAFSQCNINIDDFVNEIGEDEVLPWDHFDIGVSKQYLVVERHKSREEKITHDCRLGCTNCGLKQKGWCKK